MKLERYDVRRDRDDRREKNRIDKDHLLIGLMSGTSLDGIDAALVRITEGEDAISEVKLEGFYFLDYSNELKEMLLALSSMETARVNTLLVAHYGISEWYAKAVTELLRETGVDPCQVDAICSHGQTVWHAPEPHPFPGPDGIVTIRSSLQIGELSVLAERTGIPVIGNFRARDLAVGGEGAPLVPFADRFLFGKTGHSGRILQNIGGIANATVIPAGAKLERMFAFDTGPGNMVIDNVVKQLTDRRMHCDLGGEIAASGKVNREMLEHFLQDSYYSRKPPKSTGREMYGSAFTSRFLEYGNRRRLSHEDLIATATALTAETITNAYRDHIFPGVDVSEVIVSGGGTHNLTLMRMIRERLPGSVQLASASEFGIPDDAKEAVAFAILGHESLMGRPGNVPSVTGASKSVVLGNYCW